MILHRRTAVVLLLLGSALLIGFLTRDFLVDLIVRPAALLIWLFGRMIQSVDQKLYWGVPIGAAVIYAFILIGKKLTDVPPSPPQDSNVTLDQIGRWRAMIPLSADEAGGPSVLRHNLGKMLAAIFTSRQADAVHWEIDDALRKRRIPLPDDVYAFLFPPEPPPGESRLQKFWRELRRAPAEWIGGLSGRKTEDYYRSIERVLAYMERSMEKKHDDQ
jgi:hypothetical protein